ncbi:CHAP domain-containing protein [Candidatus Berkelbacteria bacterium]|nr:CHAP domain-containing protein [Candidatus Berkelbacteria bacterium]
MDHLTHVGVAVGRYVWLTKQRAWIYQKLWQPLIVRSLRAGLAAILLVSLNPAASAEAAIVTGELAANPAQLAFFEYESLEVVDDPIVAIEQGFVEKPLVVTTQIGRPERALLEAEQRASERRRASKTRALPASARNELAPVSPAPSVTAGNTYAYGYCTWWAKTKRPDLPNQLGNAYSWLGRARAQGLPTGNEPRVGAIVVTAESRLGHVGYIEAVEGDEIVVSDMNIVGWNTVSKRRMKASAGVIRGYIY